MRFFICIVICIAMACTQVNQVDDNESNDLDPNTHPIAAAAIELTKGPYVMYDPAYQSIPYPNGDVATDRGVCADVVIRTLRTCTLPGYETGMDLQQLVHEDMMKNFRLYPQKWGLSSPDKNIDHRRVPNLITYFTRRGLSISTEENPESYLPGDIVAWELNDGRPHIGIVVNELGSNGWPLVVHNIGYGQQKANVLFSWKIVRHFRF